MMPYFAPEAHIPITSCAPRLAAMNARLVIHTGTERPEVRKSALVATFAFNDPADAKDENKVQRQDQVVDRGKPQTA
jgi:hypothetical protein